MKLMLFYTEKTVHYNYLAERLTKRNIQTYIAFSQEEAHYWLSEMQPDVCIVIGMANNALLQRWRTNGMGIPVMIIREMSCSSERILAYHSGADDFVAHHVDLDEIICRAQALIRRMHGHSTSIVSHPPYELSMSARELKINGIDVKLTSFEFIVLQALMLRAGKVVTNEQLMLRLYGEYDLQDFHTISVIISRLRKKIKSVIPHECIINMRMQGYSFRPSSKDIDPHQ